MQLSSGWIVIVAALVLLSLAAAVAIWAAGALNRDPECLQCGSREVDLGTDEHGEWFWECQTCGYCWAAAVQEHDRQA